jgi:hypothetical protein
LINLSCLRNIKLCISFEQSNFLSWSCFLTKNTWKTLAMPAIMRCKSNHTEIPPLPCENRYHQKHQWQQMVARMWEKRPSFTAGGNVS